MDTFPHNAILELIGNMTELVKCVEQFDESAQMYFKQLGESDDNDDNNRKEVETTHDTLCERFAMVRECNVKMYRLVQQRHGTMARIIQDHNEYNTN